MPADFQREYLLHLPLPLAQLYSRAHNAKDARARHDNTFYLCEALIKLAASPAISCYLHEAEQSPANRVAALDKLLLQLALPSLGQWLGFLRELARSFGSRPDAARHPLGHLWDQLNRPRKDLPALLALFRRIKNGADGEPAGDQSCSLLQALDALVQYRNGVFGHGGPRFESFFEKDMGPLLFPAVNDLLAEGTLEFLGPRGARLVYLSEVRELDESKIEIGLRELVGLQGERSAPLVLDGQQGKGLAPGRVAVLWPGRAWPLLLAPLLTYREGELAEEVLFLNRDRNSKQLEYLSYTTGRTERERTMAPALAALLSRVAGKAVSEEQLARFQEQSLAETPSVEGLIGEQPLAAQVLGDYEVLAELGRGGMGVVYLARQLSLGRLVALKTLPADLAGDEVAVARLRREVRALSQCEHPHIVKVLSSGTLADGGQYFTMEYVPGADLDRVWRELSSQGVAAGVTSLGGSTWARAARSAAQKRRQELQDRSTSGGRVPESVRAVGELSLPALPELPGVEEDEGGYIRRVVTLVRDAALALQAVHDQNLVHRDVKPANLMLTPDGERIVLMDFGLAKGAALSSVTRGGDGGLRGTLRYAAPEQLAAASLKVGPAADLRGLGVTLWELLTRRRLFAEAEDEKQLALKVHEEDVPRLRSVDGRFDRDLEAIVARATERRQADRIARAGQLAEYLQLWLEGKALPIRAPGVGELLLRWVREHKPLVGSAAAALLAVVISVLVALVLITQAKDRAEDEAEQKGRLAVAEQLQRERADREANIAIRLAGEEKSARQQAETAKQNAEEAKRRAEYQTLCAEQVRHAFQLDAAVRAWKADDVARAEAILVNATRAEQLTWEHRFVQAICRRRTLRIRGLASVESVAWSPDGQRIASAGGTKVKVWDAQTGKELLSLEGHTWVVNSVTWSPDSQRLASGSWDNSVKVWDAQTGQTIFTLQGHTDHVTTVAWGPDGQRLASGSHDRTVKVWDVQAGKEIFTLSGHTGLVDGVAWSPDGQRLASGSWDRMVKVWNAQTGQELHSLKGHTGYVHSVAWSPDGQRLVSGGGEPYKPGEVKMWDAQSGQGLRSVQAAHTGPVNSVAWSPDGNQLASGSDDQTVKTWDAQTGQGLRSLRAHTGPVQSVAWGPDSMRLASGSKDTIVNLWDFESGQEKLSFKGDRTCVNAVAWSADGNRIAGAGFEETAKVWDAETGQELLSLKGHTKIIHSVAWSADGKYLASGSEDDTVKVWDAQTGKVKYTLKGHASLVTSVAWDADKRLASGSGLWDAKQSKYLGGEVKVWDAETGQEKLSLKGHSSLVVSVAWSPDGRRLASGCVDGTVNLWDAQTGKELLSLPKHTDRVGSIRWSPDGQRIASGGDKVVKVWNAQTGEDLLSLKGHTGSVDSVAISADGTRIATASFDKTVRVWDAQTGQEKLTIMGHSESIKSVAWSPDGQRLVSGGGDKTVRVWDARTPRETHILDGHSSYVVCAAWSVDGQYMASGSFDNSVTVWVTETGQRLFSLKGHTGSVSSVAWSADGRRLVSGSYDQTVKVWDAQTEREILSLKGHTGRIQSVAWSADGKYLASGSWDKTVKLWDAQTGQEVHSLNGHRDAVWSVAWSPNGQRVASGSWDRTVKVWDARTGQEILSLDGHAGPVESVVWSADGRRLASGSWDKTVKVWDAQTGRELLSLQGHTFPVESVTWSTDGQRLASGDADQTLKWWDAETGQELLTVTGRKREAIRVTWSPDGRRIAQDGPRQGVALWDAETGQQILFLMESADRDGSAIWSPDSQRIASACWANTLNVWDAQTGQKAHSLKGHTSAVQSAAWSPDGQRLASGSYDQTVKIWDVQTGKQLFSLKGHTNSVSAVAWSPDGQRLASGSWDKTLKVWNAQTGKEMLSLPGHTDWVTHLAWSPDGQHLASGSWDKTVKVWDAQTGRALLSLQGHTGLVEWVTWSADGKHLASGSYDTTVKVWDAQTGKELLTLEGHKGPVYSVAFSPDGQRVLVRDELGKALTWDVRSGHLLPGAPSAVPVGFGVVVHDNYMAYLDGRSLRVEPIFTPEEQREQQRIRRILQTRASREFHTIQAEAAEKDYQPFAAVFHLDRLLELLPAERSRLLVRRNSILTAALVKAPGDPWAARTLARQALTSPQTVPERTLLVPTLAALAKKSDLAADHRLHGGLLVRVGSACEGITALQTAIKKRGADSPPVEELLLALAHIQLKQPAEARKYLQMADALMRRGPESVRASALTGLAACGPLAPLGSLVVTPPDPHPSPLDHQTAYEVATLRAEIKDALAPEAP